MMFAINSSSKFETKFSILEATVKLHLYPENKAILLSYETSRAYLMPAVLTSQAHSMFL